MNANAVANLGSGIKGDVGQQMDRLGKMAVGADVIAALQDAARANPNVVVQNTIGPDMRGGIDLNRGIENGGGMNTRRENGLRKEQRQNFGKRDASIEHSNERFFARSKRTIDDDR